jgi:hypothetical protein
VKLVGNYLVHQEVAFNFHELHVVWQRSQLCTLNYDCSIFQLLLKSRFVACCSLAYRLISFVVTKDKSSPPIIAVTIV